MKQITSRDICEGPLPGNIFKYTFPIIITNMLSLMFNAVDLVMVGRFCGSVSLAAVGATGSLISLMINLFIGLSIGVCVQTAQSIGAKNSDAVERTVHTGIATALCCGVFLTIFSEIFAKYFLVLMDTPENVLDYAVLYLRIYLSGSIFNLMYTFVAAVLRAGGDTKTPMYILLGAGVLNVGLNALFLAVFKMNVEGVAIATVISQALSAVLVTIVLLRRRDEIRLRVKNIRFDKVALKKILYIGLPAGLQSTLFSISNVFLTSLINSFGDVALTGSTAAQNIESFVYQAMTAFTQTEQTYISQNYGAGNYKRITKVMLVYFAFTCATGLVLGVLVNVFGTSLLGIYITDSAEAIEYGLIRLRYICGLYLICGAMEAMNSTLRGLGASIIPMTISVFGCGFRIVFAAYFAKALQSFDGLFASYPISWLLTLAGEVVLFLILRKKLLGHKNASIPAA